METSLQEIKDHLIATDEQFSRLANEHSEHKRRLAELSGKTYLTESEQIEEVTLKKRKLALKDQMEMILQKHKKSAVA